MSPTHIGLLRKAVEPREEVSRRSPCYVLFMSVTPIGRALFTVSAYLLDQELIG